MIKHNLHNHKICDTLSVIYIRTKVPPHSTTWNSTEPTSIIPLLFATWPSYHMQARIDSERIQIYTRWIIMITGRLDVEWLARPVPETSPWSGVKDQGRVSDLANIQGAWTELNQSQIRKIKEGDLSVCSTGAIQLGVTTRSGLVALYEGGASRLHSWDHVGVVCM